MVEKKEKLIESEQGFTMIELIIVIAIMGILSAILVPSFSNMTRKTRLKADITTIQQVQMQLEIYMAEKDGEFPGGGVAKEYADKILPELAIKALVDEEYIKSSDTTNNTAIALQTKEAQGLYKGDTSHLVLDISKADEKIRKTAGNLTDKEREWLHGQQ